MHCAQHMYSLRTTRTVTQRAIKLAYPGPPIATPFFSLNCKPVRFNSFAMSKHWNYPKDDDLILTALRGLTAANPALLLISSEKVVYNQATAQSKVAVISGGGAGHEPLHLGFVGSNLLDAAVNGAIFASPSTRQIMAAVRASADKEKGAVIVVKNYTGDVLHFGLVAERAKRDGYRVELVFAADDVAVGRTQNAMVGRRGLAGTAVIHKTVGGAAATGGELEQVAELGRSVNDAMVTMGASLDRTSVPGRHADETELTGAGKAELGLGIHNEPGEKISIPDIRDLVDTMYKRLLDADDAERHYVDFSDDADYVLVVNNIGGTSTLELLAITHYAVERCPLAKKPARVYVSDFVTSLNAPGFSLSLLNLQKAATDSYSADKILHFLDLPTDAPGWKPKPYSPEQWKKGAQEVDVAEDHAELPHSDLKIDGAKFSTALKAAMNHLIEKEPLITKYDTQVGDGDCGETLENGARGVLKFLDSADDSLVSDPVSVLSAITEVVEERMGGTSGGIYAIFLTSLVKHLQECKDTEIPLIAEALHGALYEGLFKYTKARVGGRTLVDTLQPFVDSLTKSGDLKKAVTEARGKCEATAHLGAKFGRASYVNESEFEGEGGVPDPGAVGLLAIIEGFCSHY